MASIRRQGSGREDGSMLHANRVASQVEHLQKSVLAGGMDRRDFSAQILCLSRFIDHAVASKQKPISQHAVLQGLRQFTRYKDDLLLRPAIMVLMLSIKSACLAGWFKQSDVDEFLSSFTKVFDFFLLDGECWKPTLSNENAEAEAFIRMICERYYPRFSLVSVVVALTVKLGYEVRGCDFQITSQLVPFTKLRIFVCGKDNTETSTCLVTPPLLSFLLNGRAVEKRVFLSSTAEAGPQLPTDVTTLLRIGCNFLQIIGDCTANYFVAVAVMGSRQWSSSSVQLQDYVVPSPSAHADDEVIVGQSRVSLRCPISHKRIKTPVKGVSCKHHQVFDYDSYIEINDRRPSWRCPCCNTHVNCPELRLDQQMQQVLKEVEENVFDVMINQDGSWTSDVSQDDMDNGHRVIVHRAGDNAGGTLEVPGNVIIDLSDDEDDEDQDVLVTGQFPAREPSLPQVSPLVSTSKGDIDMEDRKPDIRSLLNSSAGTGASSTCTPISVVGPNMDLLPSPVLSAIYSPIIDAQGHGGPGTVNITRSLHEPQGGVRNMIQNPIANSWTTAMNSFAPSLPILSGLSSENRPSSTERQLYPPPNRAPVIQALAAPTHLPTHFPNPNARLRISPSLPSSSNTLLQGGAGVSSSQLQNQSAPTLDYQHQTFQHSQTSDMRVERRHQELWPPSNILPLRGYTHPDSALRSQRQGQRVPMQQVVQNGHGNVQDFQMQNSGGVRPFVAGQGQQFSNQLGLQAQYPLSATQQSATNLSRQQIQMQAYLHRQRLAQQVQYPAQASGNSWVSVGGGSALNSGVSFPPAAVVANSRISAGGGSALNSGVSFPPGGGGSVLNCGVSFPPAVVVTNSRISAGGPALNSGVSFPPAPGVGNSRVSAGGAALNGGVSFSSAAGVASSRVSAGGAALNNGISSSSAAGFASPRVSAGGAVLNGGVPFSSAAGVGSSRVSAGGGTALSSGISFSSTAGVTNPWVSAGGIALNSGVSFSSAAGVSTGELHQVLPTRLGSHPVYTGGTTSVTNNPLAAVSSSGVEGWAPNVNWRPAGTPRMRGAVGGAVPAGLLPGRVGSSPSATQPGPVNRARVPTNMMNTSMLNLSNLATTTQWGGGSSSAFAGGIASVSTGSNSAVSGIGSGELYNGAVPMSTNAILPDISWPSLPLTPLESHLDSIGSQDSGFWIDDSLFTSSHP